MSQPATVNISKRSLSLLRISIGVIYLWFGALKFFHGYSPAEDLAIKTIGKLTLEIMPQQVTIVLLAIWECVVGILLISNKWIRPILVLLLVHMACTFTPLVFFPSDSFRHAPYGFTLVGQYIMKNIIIICAAFIIRQQAAANNEPNGF